ncbi:MAG TPA: Rv3654c family TadE-like protein [Pseudonocardiaceae bacterium]
MADHGTVDQAAADQRAADHGSATLWSVGGIAVLFLVAAMVLAVGAVVQTRHRATSAADLAALAAAVGAPEGTSAACTRARWVTDQMRAMLTGCRIVDWNALVEVSAALPGELSRFGQVTAHSMAGPADN